jgi:hypothetical protein
MRHPRLLMCSTLIVACSGSVTDIPESIMHVAPPATEPIPSAPEGPSLRVDAGSTEPNDAGQEDAGFVAVDAGVGSAGPDAGVSSRCADAGPPRNGLKLWLQAGVGLTVENNRVTAWADQSGGAPATMGNPAQRPTLVANGLNGKPFVRFTGGREALQRSVPVDGLRELTIAVVNATPALWKDDPAEWCHRRDCNPNGPPGQRVVSETGCSGTYQKVLWWNGTADWTGVYLSPKQEEISFRFGTGAKTYSDNPCNIRHDPKVAWPRSSSIKTSFSFTVAIHKDITDRLYVHGEKVSETQSPGGMAVVKAQDRLDIGNGFGWVEGTNRGGDIAEVLVYTRALADAERSELERYVHCSLFPERIK